MQTAQTLVSTGKQTLSIPSPQAMWLNSAQRLRIAILGKFMEKIEKIVVTNIAHLNNAGNKDLAAVKLSTAQ